MIDPTHNIQLTLTVTEVNQILDALGKRPYTDVYRLVTNIQQQADQQLRESDVPPGRVLVPPEEDFDPDEPPIK